MFSNELENEFSKIGSLTLNYEIFKNVCVDVINKHAPLKGSIQGQMMQSTWIRS